MNPIKMHKGDFAQRIVPKTEKVCSPLDQKCQYLDEYWISKDVPKFGIACQKSKYIGKVICIDLGKRRSSMVSASAMSRGLNLSGGG